MAEIVPAGEKEWLMIPFYSDLTSAGYNDTLSKFEDFLVKAKVVTGLNLVVVDDGCGLAPERLGNTPDLLISIPENRGKAYAIREGLKTLLGNPNTNPRFIVQYDGDGDQSYIDIPRLRDRLVDIAGGDPNTPALVIGDRYSEGLSITPNPDSVDYRQSILLFFGALAEQFGFDGVRDWVSGARGYSQRYASEFLNRSKSSRYGLESEQLVVAYLAGARVGTASLRESRPRDPHTLTSKWLQNFEVYLDHEDELRRRGQGHTVDLVKTLVRELREELDTFQLDLTPLGEDTKMQFTRIGDRYTAQIPKEYRKKLFMEAADFPFTIRRP